MGPALSTIAPWLEGTPPGSPPSPGTEMTYVPLLRYSTVMASEGHRMNGYSHADSWPGGAWLNSGNNSAVIFAGTKGSGYTWYGFYTPEGVDPAPLYPEGAPCAYLVGDLMCTQPDGVTPCDEDDLAPCSSAVIEEESRGWWASRFDAVFLFYDPNDLARVAAGIMEPWEPQPYAYLDIDDHLYLNAEMADVATYIGYGEQRHTRLGDITYDSERNLIYVLELFSDEYRPVVHVWHITPAERSHRRPFDK